MKPLITLFFLLVFANSLYSQITLTESDLPSTDKKYYEVVKKDGLASITPGEDGANKTWDFSSLTSNLYDTSVFMSSSSLSQIAVFEGSNLAQRFSDGYEYYNINKSYAAISGLAQYVDGEYLIFDLDDLPIFIFPASYSGNDSFSNTRVSYYKTKNNNLKDLEGYDSLRYKMIYTQSMNIKGWGNLKTPLFTKEVVKAKATSTVLLNLSFRDKKTGIWAASPTTKKTVSSKYYFYAKEIGVPLLTLSYSDSTDANLRRVSWYSGQGTPQSMAYPKYLDDNQYHISPNPSNGNLHLIAPDLSEVDKITVLDVLGKEVTYSGDVNTGKIEIDAPNGIYNVNLYTGKGIIVKRVLIQN